MTDGRTRWADERDVGGRCGATANVSDGGAEDAAPAPSSSGSSRGMGGPLGRRRTKAFGGGGRSLGCAGVARGGLGGGLVPPSMTATLPPHANAGVGVCSRSWSTAADPSVATSPRAGERGGGGGE
ncbi:MAG: hypothetical protein ACLQVI_32160 [Polyangiaceae bacterium]